MTVIGLKIPRLHTKMNRFSVSIISVILFSVICRLEFANSSQPAYNQSGAKHQQTSEPKERSEDTDSSGAPPAQYSRSRSSNVASSKPFSTFTTSPHYYYPVSDPYYDDFYERERPGRKFSARSVPSTYPLMAVAASNQIGFDSDYAATGHEHEHGGGGHGGGGHGGGHGGGWGWGWANSHGSGAKIDNSSLGLLGLLGLLSLLSNVLMLLTTTAATTAAAGGGRKRRDVHEEDLDGKERVVHLCQQILPSLNVIGHAQNGNIPVNCTSREVCRVNQILVNEFGTQGRSVGSMLSSAILKMLKEVDQSLTVDKYLLQAGKDGRDGKDCESFYQSCAGKEILPQLISPEHVAAIVHGRDPQIFTSSQ